MNVPNFPEVHFLNQGRGSVEGQSNTVHSVFLHFKLVKKYTWLCELGKGKQEKVGWKVLLFHQVKIFNPLGVQDKVCTGEESAKDKQGPDNKAPHQGVKGEQDVAVGDYGPGLTGEVHGCMLPERGAHVEVEGNQVDDGPEGKLCLSTKNLEMVKYERAHIWIYLLYERLTSPNFPPTKVLFWAM